VGATWTDISSLATAGGTLVLAVATFASVRSANRAARTAERAFDVGLRPVLFASRLDDSVQKIRWVDDHWAKLMGGRATMEMIDGRVYMAISLRNVGSGIAVLHGWRARPFVSGAPVARPALEDFWAQQRDLYVPPGDISFWQAALREESDPGIAELADTISAGSPVFVDILYSDLEGSQRTITRFLATHWPDDDLVWFASVGRHWTLDRIDPREGSRQS
jgi:hypothetical protein